MSKEKRQKPHTPQEEHEDKYTDQEEEHEEGEEEENLDISELVDPEKEEEMQGIVGKYRQKGGE